MLQRKLYTIPVDYDSYPDTDAVCLTGVTQLKWIAQLVVSKVNYVLHIDGKYKLHHGKWMMLSIGVHDIALGTKGIVHSYRPLVYMFVKQQETAQSVELLCAALDWIAETYYGSKLTPGVTVMDHSTGFRNGVLREWPDTGTHAQESRIKHESQRIIYISRCIADTSTRCGHTSNTDHSGSQRIIKISGRIAGISTCWPHLKRKVVKGEYLSSTDPFYQELLDLMDGIHMAQTEDMMRVLIMKAGEVIHPKLATHPKLRTLWNEYFVEPWDCWCIGLHMDTPLNISNNQPIESWHKSGVMRVVRKALKGSTAAVLEHSFPKIVYRDSIIEYQDGTRSITHDAPHTDNECYP